MRFRQLTAATVAAVAFLLPAAPVAAEPLLCLDFDRYEIGDVFWTRPMTFCFLAP